MDINIDDLSKLRQFKIGTVDWLNNLQRIAKQKIGRELNANEVKGLYQMELANSAKSNYKPNFIFDTQYSGKPGNIKTSNGPIKYKGQVNPNRLPVPQPRGTVGPTIQANTPIAKQLPSTNVFPNFTTQGGGNFGGVGSIPRGTSIPTPQPNNGIAGYLPGRIDPFANRRIPKPTASVNTASKAGGILDILKAPTGRGGKITGGLTSLLSVPYLTTAGDTSRTTKDRVLDTATGLSFLTGLASLYPQGRIASTLMNVLGKVGPIAGTGLALIPRDNTATTNQIGKIPTDDGARLPMGLPQSNDGNEMVNRVANAVNSNLGTNIPLINSTPVNGQASGVISGSPKYVGDMANKINQIAKAKNKSAEEIGTIVNKIIAEANRQGVDPALALTMVQMESGFDTNATSPAGAGGLFQLMPGTAKDLGVKNVYDPDQNIKGGIAYLRQQLRANPGHLNMALASYNAGPGTVAKYGGVPPYEETRNYIDNIAHNIPVWRNLLNGNTNIGNGHPVMANNNQSPVGTIIPGGGMTTYMPQPSTTGSWEMLKELYQQQQNRPTNLDVNINGAYEPYDPYEYMTPNELRSLQNLRNMNTMLDPDTMAGLIDDYYKEQRRANMWNLIHSPSNTKMEPQATGLGKLKALYDFIANQNENEMKLYDSLMKRSDAMRMAKRYGIPYSAIADNMNGVLQYVVGPEIAQRYKNENRIPDTMMELIKTQATGEQTRANDINKANALINTVNNEWGNWKYPLGVSSILSKEKMNSVDNLAKGVGYYAQAEIAKYKADAQNKLVQIGIPPKMASALSMAIPYMSKQDQQVAIQYIMNMTGVSANEASDIVNSVPIDNSADIVNTLLGGQSGVSGGWGVGD